MLVSVADVWLDAKLNVPRMTPTEQRAIAPKARRLKKPDCEAELFCIGVGLSSRSAKRHRRTFLVSNFSSPMEAFYAIENRLSSIFPIKRKSFLLVPRFVLRIGRDGGKLRVPISVALPEKSDGDDARDPREFWRALAPFILRRLWRTHHC